MWKRARCGLDSLFELSAIIGFIYQVGLQLLNDHFGWYLVPLSIDAIKIHSYSVKHM